MTTLDNEDFQDAIKAIVAPANAPDASQRAPFKKVWEDFAQALSKHADVAATIIPSNDGRRWHLTLAPRFRPAWRNSMLTYTLDAGSTTVFGQESRSFDSPGSLKAWLKLFAASSSFQDSLAVLREQEGEPVLAILKDSNDESCTVIVPPECQQQLHDSSSPDLNAEIELLEGETLPSGQISRFTSAGLEFSVREARISGRKVSLQLSRIL